MTLKMSFVKREIAGETFLVPVGEAAKKYSGLIILNELGSFLWDLIAEGKDEAELLSAILGEYEISREEAQADMKEFLDRLAEMGIL